MIDYERDYNSSVMSPNDSISANNSYLPMNKSKCTSKYVKLNLKSMSDCLDNVSIHVNKYKLDKVKTNIQQITRLKSMLTSLEEQDLGIMQCNKDQLERNIKNHKEKIISKIVDYISSVIEFLDDLVEKYKEYISQIFGKLHSKIKIRAVEPGELYLDTRFVYDLARLLNAAQNSALDDNFCCDVVDENVDESTDNIFDKDCCVKNNGPMLNMDQCNKTYSAIFKHLMKNLREEHFYDNPGMCDSWSQKLVNIIDVMNKLQKDLNKEIDDINTRYINVSGPHADPDKARAPLRKNEDTGLFYENCCIDEDKLKKVMRNKYCETPQEVDTDPSELASFLAGEKKYRDFKDSLCKQILSLRTLPNFLETKMPIMLPCMFYNREKNVQKTLSLFACLIKARKYLFAIKILEHISKDLSRESPDPDVTLKSYLMKYCFEKDDKGFVDLNYENTQYLVNLGNVYDSIKTDDYDAAAYDYPDRDALRADRNNNSFFLISKGPSSSDDVFYIALRGSSYNDLKFHNESVYYENILTRLFSSKRNEKSFTNWNPKMFDALNCEYDKQVKYEGKIKYVLVNNGLVLNGLDSELATDTEYNADQGNLNIICKVAMTKFIKSSNIVKRTLNRNDPDMISKYRIGKKMLDDIVIKC